VAITFNQLNHFLAVVESGSVSGAAEKLVITQPSVSAALAALSEELGVELTERVGRSIRLTPAARAFLPFAADVLGLLEQGKQAAREAAEPSLRQLRIAAVTTAGEYIVPPLLRAFSNVHPEIGLTLEVGNRRRVFQRVVEHGADLAIGGRPPPDGRLTGRPFLENEIVLIAAPDDPLVRRRSVPVDELAALTWLLREEDSGTRMMVEDFLGNHDLRPRTVTLGSNGAIKQAVRAGLGVSLQSRVAVDLELESGVLATVPVRGGLPARRWYVLRSAAGQARAPVDEFVAFVGTRAAREAVEDAQRAMRGNRRRTAGP
jgi:LysR family transcriptional regulator, low CO2-responsive transcriptional regulator